MPVYVIPRYRLSNHFLLDKIYLKPKCSQFFVFVFVLKQWRFAILCVNIEIPLLYNLNTNLHYKNCESN